MRVVLDKNVLVSGVFFSGPPSRILKAWRDGRLTLVYSAAIFEEYDRVFMELTDDFPAINARLILDLLENRAVFKVTLQQIPVSAN
jgi:predicted nucleic acid-binding protein